ncbi:hypothetical protein QR680_008245 [Steinernema hermaphroditum]|uniref:Uncharacterized protein n=1 Tax=Steinernema hermaphroditum TaxID=289476 RepID=A0AA39M7S4_9BILA|nr:hypothetical protein QR680_008245 [Steinernema hermaphroditum]
MLKRSKASYYVIIGCLDSLKISECFVVISIREPPSILHIFLCNGGRKPRRPRNAEKKVDQCKGLVNGATGVLIAICQVLYYLDDIRSQFTDEHPRIRRTASGTMYHLNEILHGREESVQRLRASLPEALHIGQKNVAETMRVLCDDYFNDMLTIYFIHNLIKCRKCFCGEVRSHPETVSVIQMDTAQLQITNGSATFDAMLEQFRCTTTLCDTCCSPRMRIKEIDVCDWLGYYIMLEILRDNGKPALTGMNATDGVLMFGYRWKPLAMIEHIPDSRNSSRGHYVVWLRNRDGRGSLILDDMAQPKLVPRIKQGLEGYAVIVFERGRDDRGHIIRQC